MHNKIFGYILIILGIIVLISETFYFGGNFLPKSFIEVVFDIFSVTLMLIGINLIKKDV